MQISYLFIYLLVGHLNKKNGWWLMYHNKKKTNKQKQILLSVYVHLIMWCIIRMFTGPIKEI